MGDYVWFCSLSQTILMTYSSQLQSPPDKGFLKASRTLLPIFKYHERSVNINWGNDHNSKQQLLAYITTAFMQFVTSTRLNSCNEKYKWKIQRLHTNVAIDHITTVVRRVRVKKGARRLSVGSSAVLVIVNSVINTHTRSLVNKQYSPSRNTNMKVQQVFCMKIIFKCYSNFQADNVANNTSKSNNKYSRHMGIQA